jgi:4-hydroxybutyryl-CoA dehydratase/vinylacetyl-CoA-Delta-isomerase
MNAVTPLTERNVETAEERWARMPYIRNGEDYLVSLRDRDTKLFLFGEKIDEPADHPMITPSINALKKTYDLAEDEPELATAHSSLIDDRVNRFLHIVESPDDLVMKHKMQRRLGQITGTCFQRCTGLDTISVMHSITYEIDDKYGSDYHQRFLEFLKEAQRRNVLIAVGMTDPKGDRSKRPHEQEDPDMFLHVSGRNEQGVFIKGAKAHMTGGWNQHWICVVPTMSLGAQDEDYAIIGMVPGDAEGVTYIYGRQSCDTRVFDGEMDQGNAKFSGQEVLVYFDDVFIPYEHVFMDGEYEFCQETVGRFTDYHRSSYLCKTGLGDVMIGAAATVAEYNGLDNVSHIKDKLVEMTHLNETIYSSGMASSHEARQLPSGIYINDSMMSNVCKHNVTRFPYEISRLAQDLAGGLMVTMPSEKDLNDEEAGEIIKKFLKGRDDIPTEDRMRIMRLVENMTVGRNAVGYLTESMHGAGSPQAQRIEILRKMGMDDKKWHARKLAGIEQE